MEKAKAIERRDEAMARELMRAFEEEDVCPHPSAYCDGPRYPQMRFGFNALVKKIFIRATLGGMPRIPLSLLMSRTHGSQWCTVCSPRIDACTYTYLYTSTYAYTYTYIIDACTYA